MCSVWPRSSLGAEIGFEYFSRRWFGSTIDRFAIAHCRILEHRFILNARTDRFASNETIHLGRGRLRSNLRRSLKRRSAQNAARRSTNLGGWRNTLRAWRAARSRTRASSVHPVAQTWPPCAVSFRSSRVPSAAAMPSWSDPGYSPVEIRPAQQRKVEHQCARRPIIRHPLCRCLSLRVHLDESVHLFPWEKATADTRATDHFKLSPACWPSTPGCVHRP